MRLSRPTFWDGRRGLFSILLLPVSWVYRGLTILHRKITQPIETQCFIICVGNAVAGGAGKTPTCLAIMDMIKNNKTCFLSKNYKGLMKEPHLIQEGDRYPDIGDEALLLAKEGPTIIARDRRAGIRLAEANGFDVVIMDDGYQNPTIKPDLRILVMGGEGNGRLLPAGPLRQPLAEAKNWADAVIDTPVAEVVPPLPDTNKAYTAFSGIARPQKFFQTLRDQGYTLIATHAFPDHHDFTIEELVALGDGPLITTEKDWMRLPPTWQGKISTLKIRAVLPESTKELIRNI